MTVIHKTCGMIGKVLRHTPTMIYVEWWKSKRFICRTYCYPDEVAIL